MKEVTGDILKLAGKGEFDIVIHGCNCESIMGAGLAKQISEEYPAAKDADANLSHLTPDQKIGGVVGVTVRSNENPGVVFTILNGYTQKNSRGARGEVLVDYDAIRSVFKTVANNYSTYRIAYPKIGAGKAHGDWDTIKAIIEEELDGLDHTLVLFDGN